MQFRAIHHTRDDRDAQYKRPSGFPEGLSFIACAFSAVCLQQLRLARLLSLERRKFLGVMLGDDLFPEFRPLDPAARRHEDRVETHLLLRSPSISSESSSKIGASIWQGPHHFAQKSTRTFLSHFNTSSSKLSLLNITSDIWYTS